MITNTFIINSTATINPATGLCTGALPTLNPPAGSSIQATWGGTTTTTPGISGSTFSINNVGYGISAKVSVEMFKGLIKNGGQYERVPKFNVVKKSDKVDGSYATLKELPWLEMFMLVYTSVGIMFALVNASWGIMAYLLVYWAGYFAVAFSIVPLGTSSSS